MGSSPPPTHISSTSKCGTILVEIKLGSWQKDSYTTKTVRKIHLEWVGREEKQSSYDQHPWEGMQKRKGITSTSSMGSEQCTPHIGCPSPWV